MTDPFTEAVRRDIVRHRLDLLSDAVALEQAAEVIRRRSDKPRSFGVAVARRVLLGAASGLREQAAPSCAARGGRHAR